MRKRSSEQDGNPSGKAWQEAGRVPAWVVRRTTVSLRGMGDVKGRSKPEGSGRDSAVDTLSWRGRRVQG